MSLSIFSVKTLTTFGLGYFFKGVCIAYSVEQRDNISLWERTDLFSYTFIRIVSPSGARLDRFANNTFVRLGFPYLRVPKP